MNYSYSVAASIFISARQGVYKDPRFVAKVVFSGDFSDRSY